MTAAILPTAAERRLARELADMRSMLDTILEGQRATQLENSTLYGNLTARDANGTIRGVIGVQPDGTWASVAQNGPPPDRPSTPVVTPSMAGIIVTWNGQLVSGTPADLLGVQVYVSRLGADFVPDATNLKGLLQHAGDFPVGPLDAGVTYWVKFRGMSTSVQANGEPLLGVESFASSATPGQVVAAAVIAGIIDDLALAAEAVTKAKIAANAVDGTKIEPDSISSPHIVAQAIQALHVAADAIQAGAVAAEVITGREIRALSILAQHINANEIEAGHLKAGIIDADKLASILVLATRMVLGDPAGARMEIDATGLDQFDDSGARTLQFGADPMGGNFLTIVDPANPQSALASIADTGVVTAQSFAVAGSMGYQGVELNEHFDALPKGILTWGSRGIGDYTTDMTGIMELEVQGQPNRVYRIIHSACFVEPQTPGTANVQGEMRLHYTLDGSRPTTSSRVLGTTGRSAPGDYGGLMSNWGQVQTSDQPVRIRVLLTYQSHFGLGSRFITGGYDNGLLFWIEDAGPTITPGGVSSAGSGTGSAAMATYVRTWNATWARSWDNGGTAVRFTNSELLQGYFNDGVHGDQVCAFGFPDVEIRGALVGATIDKVELYLYAHHWYWNSGGQARLRTHNSAETDTYPPVSAVISTPAMGKPEGRWVALSTIVGDNFKNGTVRGFALDARDVARNLLNYGRFDGPGWGSPPRLRITFRSAGTGGGSGGTTTPTIPAPTGFTATWNATGPTVTKNWTPTPNTDSTEVHEFLADPNDTLKATIAYPGGTRTSSQLTNGNTYLYAVRARRGTQVSPFSPAIRISNTGQSTEAAPGGGGGGDTGLAAPTGFTSSMNSSRVVSQSWTPTPGAAATEVHEFLVDPSSTLKATVAAPGNTRTTGVLAGGRDYLYAARAVQGSALSPFSNGVRIKADGTWVADNTMSGTGGTGGGGGGGTITGTPSNPGEALWIGTGDGQNHYNVGVGTDQHRDYSAATIAGGFSSPQFKLTPDALWVIFDVQIDGATTSSGTKYARSELREEDESGTGHAAWNGGSGTHTNRHVSKVMHVPPNKPSVCFTQIHDASSDLCRVQTESNGSGGLKIVMRNTPPGSSSETVRTIVSNYTIGQELDCAWSVVNGNGTFTLNGTAWTFPANTDGCYMKVGAYAQTNETIDAASEHCEVWVKAGTLETWHTGYPAPTKAPWTLQVTGGGTGGGGTTGGVQRTAGPGGVPTPAGAILATADSTAPLDISTSGTASAPRVYDGQGHTIGRVTVSGNYVVVQNYNIRPGNQYAVYITGHHNTVQNCDIKNVRVSGDGDLNAVTVFNTDNKILYNTANDFVSGDPGGSHTDFCQTWVSASHPDPANNLQIIGNSATGPNNPSRTDSVASIHQFFMCEGAGHGGNSGGSGNPTNILISDNTIGCSWGQDIKLDGAANVDICRNRFVGSSDHACDFTSGTNLKFYATNTVGSGYGNTGVSVTAGDGPPNPYSTGGTTSPTGGTTGTVPGDVIDLARWYLTLPIADPTGQDSSGPWDVYQPALASFSHASYFYLGSDGWVNYVAPVAGVTTSASSGATRSELREMLAGLTKADWGFNDGKDHVLTCTLTCDATSISGRKEVIVGQIHDTTGTPPIYLAVNQNSSPGSLNLFKNGPAAGTLLTGIGPTTVFTYRIAVTGSGSARRCYIYAGLGEAVPTTPQYSFPVSDFSAQTSGCYLKAGAYNKEPISGSGVGASRVRHKVLTVV